MPVEELAEGGCRSRLARRDPRRNLQLERLGRDHGTRKREHAIDNNREAGANDHAELFGVSTQVGCPDRERCGGSAGTGEASERGSRRAVVSRGCDHERVEPKGSLHRSHDGAVGKAGVRLAQRDERDSCRVVRIAVLVRVDGTMRSADGRAS